MKHSNLTTRGPCGPRRAGRKPVALPLSSQALGSQAPGSQAPGSRAPGSESLDSRALDPLILAAAAGVILGLGLLLAPPVLAQTNTLPDRQRPTQVQEAVNTSGLPSGRLQAVDWQNQEIQIDGKRYTFSEDSLRVYYLDKEIALFDLKPNAAVRYQFSRANGENVIVRIWADGADSLDPS